MRVLSALLLLCLFFISSNIQAQQNGCFIKKFTMNSTYSNYVYTYSWQGNYNNTWTSTDGSYGSNEYNSDYLPLNISTTSSGYTYTTTYSYYASGKLKSYTTTNWNGTTTYTYTWTNNKNNTWTGTDGSYGSNTYNADGYLTYTSSTFSGYTSTTTYTYNASNKLTKMVTTGYSNVTTTYTWTGNDNTWTNTDGASGSNDYDQYDNLTYYSYVTSTYAVTGDYEYDCNTVTNIDESNFIESPLSLFPNPANDKVYLTTAIANENTKVEIYDFSGRLLKTFSAFTSANIEEINISDFKLGIYLVAVIRESENKMIKLVVE